MNAPQADAHRRAKLPSSGRVTVLVGLLCWASLYLAAATEPKLSEVRFEDLSGHAEGLRFGSEIKAVVFLFVSVECPISNSYAPEFKRLGVDFGPKHVLIRLVYPNVDESTDAIRKHLKEFALPFPALRDPRHELVKAAGVRTTPEAAIFSPKSGFVYHGRIDNRYADLGVARPEATEHDLRDALSALLVGKPVAHTTTRAVGCSIAPLP